MLEQDQLYRSSATAIGFSAIVLWASLAWLTVMSGQIPPFELTAITFTIAAGLGFVIALSRGRGKLLWPRFSVLCLGVGGLFGDYILYFGALRLAPPLQAGLIVALWPLMMVVLSAVVLRETLRINHALGAVLGLAGVLVLTLDTHTALLFDMNYLLGYLLAFGAAVVWAGYSVLSRCYADVPTEAVTSFCFVAALLAAVGHFGWEQTLVPSDAKQVLAIIGLGLGPVGASFFVWDFGIKHGNIRILGILSNAAPVMSTILLVATGVAPAKPSLGIACTLIVVAAALATMKPLQTRTGMASTITRPP